MSEILRLENIHKTFDETEVLKGIDLSVAQGEFITLLGAAFINRIGVKEKREGRLYEM